MNFFGSRTSYVTVGIIICSVLIYCCIVEVTSGAKKKHPEKYYQEIWCKNVGGEVEVVLNNRTRVDCLTDTHAIEFDFAKKWAESLGQSLYYSVKTGKDPGIVLILEKNSDIKFVNRVIEVINKFNLPIVVWTVGGEY